MPTRLLLMTVIVTLMVVFISIYSIGHNYEKGPIKKGTCRSFLIWSVYYFGTWAYAVCIGIYSRVIKHPNVDYSKYLGQGYD